MLQPDVKTIVIGDSELDGSIINWIKRGQPVLHRHNGWFYLVRPTNNPAQYEGVFDRVYNNTFDLVEVGEYVWDYDCKVIYQRIMLAEGVNMLNTDTGAIEYFYDNTCVHYAPPNINPDNLKHWMEFVPVYGPVSEATAQEFGIGRIEDEDKYHETLQLIERPQIGTRQVLMTRADCGHAVYRYLVMNTSSGTSCPDCYDRMSL